MRVDFANLEDYGDTIDDSPGSSSKRRSLVEAEAHRNSKPKSYRDWHRRVGDATRSQDRKRSLARDILLGNQSFAAEALSCYSDD
jgi:hypothetical protein